jgi:hypothetical protein
MYCIFPAFPKRSIHVHSQKDWQHGITHQKENQERRTDGRVHRVLHVLGLLWAGDGEARAASCSTQGAGAKACGVAHELPAFASCVRHALMPRNRFHMSYVTMQHESAQFRYLCPTLKEERGATRCGKAKDPPRDKELTMLEARWAPINWEKVRKRSWSEPKVVGSTIRGGKGGKVDVVYHISS